MQFTISVPPRYPTPGQTRLKFGSHPYQRTLASLAWSPDLNDVDARWAWERRLHLELLMTPGYARTLGCSLGAGEDGSPIADIWWLDGGSVRDLAFGLQQCLSSEFGFRLRRLLVGAGLTREICALRSSWRLGDDDDHLAHLGLEYAELSDAWLHFPLRGATVGEVIGARLEIVDCTSPFPRLTPTDCIRGLMSPYAEVRDLALTLTGRQTWRRPRSSSRQSLPSLGRTVTMPMPPWDSTVIPFTRLIRRVSQLR